ncbi:hypothetical protein EV361DRAFT_127927 [Lentinula raphanica]|nr:hypothetical protein EV361DRAFT_127927 [Lentinula raphanica]
MYPFRFSTWHSLAVYVVLLSMIAPATFALPIESDTTAPRKVGQRIAARAHQAEPSRTNSVSFTQLLIPFHVYLAKLFTLLFCIFSID